MSTGSDLTLEHSLPSVLCEPDPGKQRVCENCVSDPRRRLQEDLPGPDLEICLSERRRTGGNRTNHQTSALICSAAGSLNLTEKRGKTARNSANS